MLRCGYEPVLSDFSDVLYDPRIHTHTSCIQEVVNCDMIVLVVGSRFGGIAIPEAVNLIDIEKVKSLSSANTLIKQDNNFSVTQLEILKAVLSGIPVFTFVDAGVMHDYRTYEKNKDKDILGQIEFPNVDDQTTAAYIFEFINFLQHRIENNSVISFSKMDDIEQHLQKQWSALFQRLLSEQKNKSMEEVRIDNLTNQIADLKTAILTSISGAELKETAKGAIKFRHLIDFVYQLGSQENHTHAANLLRSACDWAELMAQMQIVDFRKDDSARGQMGARSALIKRDGTYYRTRMSLSMVERFRILWDEFRGVNADAKEAIINAVLDSTETRPMMMVRHIDEIYDDERSDEDKLKDEVRLTGTSVELG